MFCQECGGSIDAGIHYCPHCGANVSGQAKQPPSTSQTQSRAPQLGPLAGQYAEFGPRMAACLTDWLIQLVGFVVLQVLPSVTLGPLFEYANYPGDMDRLDGFFISLIGLLHIACLFLYEPLLTSSRWQATLVKRALGIVVTDENGGRISFTRATGRWFAKSLSGLLLTFIVYLLQPFTPKKQALHDLLAGTLVVKP